MKTINKERRLPKEEYKRYCEYLANKYPMCQICGAKAVDSHHLVFGAYKDDRTLLNTCRACHEWCHKNKHESIEKYTELGERNWQEYVKRKLF